MKLEDINEYLESPYLATLHNYGDDEVVDAWERIIERTLFAMYNNGEPTSATDQWQILEQGRDEILQYEHAIETEERDELCAIFAAMARLGGLKPPDGQSIEGWAEW